MQAPSLYQWEIICASERLFGQYRVNHILNTQKEIKLGGATEPLPHLFLISDEFAELRSTNQTSSRNWSLSRVSGVPGYMILTNTKNLLGSWMSRSGQLRFKLALKVADRGDSMEMLRTADAAEITQTGRAYLQVEITKSMNFQTAWSEADYQLRRTS